MLCDLCKGVFSGHAEPSPRARDEFLHHQSSRSLAIALAEGCQLCLILQDLLPEHMFTSDWQYCPTDPDHNPLKSVGESGRQSDNGALAGNPSEHAERLFPFRHSKSFYRGYYTSRKKQEDKLHQSDPAERRFAFIYFRSATWDNLPTVEFLTITPTGRAAITGTFPLQVLLFNQGRPAAGEPKIPYYNARSRLTGYSSKQDAGAELEEEADDYRFGSRSTSDTSAWNAARNWFLNCLKAHGPSCTLQSPNFLPSRLVYLEDSTASQIEQAVRLCDTAQLGRINSASSAFPAYMTLSHRWNDNGEQLALTSTNIDQFRVGIPLNLLSETFQDALRFARFCSVKFVWIDALCIVQDDSEDWAREAPLMGPVYYNAVCNLNATGSGHLMKGLSSNRSHCHAAPLLVCPAPDLWNKGDATTIDLQDQYACVGQDFWKRSIDQAVVNKRAWVMQERLLSVRKVFFSEHQLFWECRKGRACEAYPNGMPEEEVLVPRVLGRQSSHGEQHLVRTIDALVRQQRCDLRNNADKCGDRRTLLVAWSGVLQQYTSCGLTYAKDRLIAIKGITSYLEEAMNDQCIHGLWRKELPYQLFFMYRESGTTSEGARRTLEGNPGVPSWSWAHLERALTLTPEFDDPEDDMRTQGGRRTPLISILDILDRLPPGLEAIRGSGTGTNPSSSGCLHLKCHLFSCSLDSEKWSENTDSHLHVLMHLGDQIYRAHLIFDGNWPDNACIMPVFWHNEKHGKALVVSRVGDETSPMMFTRTGFLGATAVFWNWFQAYWKVAAEEGEQEIWLV